MDKPARRQTGKTPFKLDDLCALADDLYRRRGDEQFADAGDLERRGSVHWVAARSTLDSGGVAFGRGASLQHGHGDAIHTPALVSVYHFLQGAGANHATGRGLHGG